MSDIATLARRIDAAADPDAYFGTLAFCLERCRGDLPVAAELADIAFGELQFDAAFESSHPRHGNGRFRPATNSGFAGKKGHRQKIQGWEKGVFNRAGEADERESPLPKTEARTVVEKALDDADLMNDLTRRARRMIGGDLQSAIDPEDIVQSAVMRGLRDADAGKFDAPDNAAGWLHTYVTREARDMGKALRAFKRRGDKGAMSLDTELDVAQRIAESSGADPAAVLGQAISSLGDKERDAFTVYYGLGGKPPRRAKSAAERSKMQRIKKKLLGHLQDREKAAERQDDPSPPTATDDYGRMAEAGVGKRKRPEFVTDRRDRREKRFESTASAHEGKVWHRKPAERAAIADFARTMKLSPEQVAAIKNVVRGGKQVEQFDISGAMKAQHPKSRDKSNYTVESIRRVKPAPFLDPVTLTQPITPYQRGRADRAKAPASIGSQQSRALPPSNYGYWITADGTPIVVGHEQHDDEAQKAGLSGTRHALQSGWVRISPFGVMVDKLSSSLVDRLNDLVIDNPSLFDGEFNLHVAGKDHYLRADDVRREGLADMLRAIGYQFDEQFDDETNSVDPISPKMRSKVGRKKFAKIQRYTPRREADPEQSGYIENQQINFGNIGDFSAGPHDARQLPIQLRLRVGKAPVGHIRSTGQNGPHGQGIGQQMYLQSLHSLPYEWFHSNAMSDEALHVRRGLLRKGYIELHGNDEENIIRLTPLGREIAEQLHGLFVPEQFYTDRRPRRTQFGDTNSVDPLPDHITSVGHKAALGAMDAARSAIADLLKKNGLALDNPDLLDEIERILNEAMPAVAQTLTESTVYAHVRGADDVLKLLDKPLPSLSPPSLPPGERWLFPGGEGDEQPIVRFPVLESAARRIATATIMSPDEFYRLGTAARENAFTITGDLTQESVGKIRDALYENLREGPSALEFGRAVDGLFEEGMPLSRGHLEQVFRNNVNGAWSDGHDKALRHELVADAFPYRAYTATHDQRVRDEHLILEHTGLDGTNIYMASDPVFQAMRPPWSWNCRCSFYPVSISRAARKGVTHAQRWLEQAKQMGVEPEQTTVEPEHVDWPTLNGERIMPPPQWQRDTQFDDARKRYIGPPGYGKEVVVQSRGNATQTPPRQAANVHDTADWMREPLQSGKDYELFKTYSRPGRFGKSFAKTGVSESAITQEHETEKFLAALGVPVPATRLVSVPSKHGGGRSMKVADWLSDHQNFDRASPSHRAMIRPHLVAQALLGNEDLASTNVKVGPRGVTFIDVGGEGIGERDPANLLSGIQGYIFEHSPQEMLTPDEYRQQVKQIGERLDSALQHISSLTRRERLKRRYATLMRHDGTIAVGVPYWPPGELRPRPRDVPKPATQWPQVRPFSEGRHASRPKQFAINIPSQTMPQNPWDAMHPYDAKQMLAHHLTHGRDTILKHGSHPEVITSGSGKKLVRKAGYMPHKIYLEQEHERFLAAMGVPIPRSSYPIEDASDPRSRRKIADFIPNAKGFHKATPDEKSRAYRHAVSHVLLGLMDTLDNNVYNVLVDEHGQPWFVDSGQESMDKTVDEETVLNHQHLSVLTPGQIRRQLDAAESLLPQALLHLSSDKREAVQKRFAILRRKYPRLRIFGSGVQ